MRSLWMDPEEQSFAPLDRDLDVDLAIVGGGFAGLGAAHASTESGAKAVLVEARTVASGASGRNAGFVLRGPAAPFDVVVAAVGRPAANEIWDLTESNNRLLAGLVDRYSIDCGFMRRGSMSLAASESEWEELRATAASLRESAIEVCLAPAVDLPSPFDQLYAGGLYYAGNAEIDPGSFLRALAAQLGARVPIYERSTVTQLCWDGQWQLSVGERCIRAATVLLATNAYTSRILPDILIVATRGQVLATAPLPEVVVPFPMYADHGYQYWRQTPAGQLVVGGWRDVDLTAEVGEDETLHPAIQRKLEGFAEMIGGVDTRIVQRWAGIMGFTPDHFPLVGTLGAAPGLGIAAGFSGHGVSMAFTCGARTAKHLLGLAVDTETGQADSIPAPFDPGRFVPVATGNLTE